MESDDSPSLWNNILQSPSQPLLDHQNHWSLSPEYSRAQAIIRGRWELMEMVKNMPESSYELSLKDLVEHPKTEAESQTTQECEKSAANNEQSLHQRGIKSGGERDWWKKKFSGSSDRDCSRTSTNTGRSSTTITISSGGSSSGRSYSVTRKKNGLPHNKVCYTRSGLHGLASLHFR